VIHRGDNPVDGPAARKAMRWRWPLTVLVVVVVAFVGLTAWLFVWPASATPKRADAVVVFAGGRGERLRTAMRLIRDGVAPTLVISNGWDPVWTDANRLCRGWSQATVLCPTPDPDTTKGEARMVAALAERSGWRSMVLVTSSYHVRRASWLLGRCYQGSVQTVAARPQPTLSLIAAIAHEWLSLPAALAGGNAAEHAKRRRLQEASEGATSPAILRTARRPGSTWTFSTSSPQRCRQIRLVARQP
jgi:uncharacterized SAM-binding protein YcdF (DUF218 family)